jgi:hypothetical protein
LAIEDFHVLLDLDLRTPLSTAQVIDIMGKAKANIESQIKEIHKEISDAESLSILQQGDKEVLNEEGLPIKDIREDVGDEEERTRAVLAEDQPTKMFSMDEIDKMMDEAMEEEQAELAKLQPKSVLKEEKMKQEKLREEKLKAEKREQEKWKASSVIAVAGDGLEVGQVNGEELLAKLVDDSKKRYNPIDDTWIEDEDEDGYADEDYDLENDDDEEEEEEEDQYGRTRGYLIPPNLSRGVKQEREVKFASYEKPATPSIGPSPVPIKSALKKTTVANSPTTRPPTLPLTSTRTTSVMADSIVERAPSQVLPPLLLTLTGRIPSNKIPRQLAN